MTVAVPNRNGHHLPVHYKIHWISIQIAFHEKFDGPLNIVDMIIVPENRQRKREKIATEYDKGCLISP